MVAPSTCRGTGPFYVHLADRRQLKHVVDWVERQQRALSRNLTISCAGGKTKAHGRLAGLAQLRPVAGQHLNLCHVHEAVPIVDGPCSTRAACQRPKTSSQATKLVVIGHCIPANFAPTFHKRDLPFLGQASQSDDTICSECNAPQSWYLRQPHQRGWGGEQGVCTTVGRS